MTRDDIQSKYQELGYQQGWTFMMTKEALLHEAPICLVGLNPGGMQAGDCVWSCEDGNAYHTQKWAKDGEDYSTLQKQIFLLEGILGLNEDSYFAAQFIPFRNPRWSKKGSPAEAVDFGRKLWEWVLGQSPAKIFLCIGKETAANVAQLIGAEAEETFPTGAGPLVIKRYAGTDGRVVVGLPHLGTYPLFGKPGGASDQAVLALKKALGQEVPEEAVSEA